MNDTCCSKTNDVMLLACSGGSNVGQLTNQAAVELTREGFGKMYCLAGLGAGLESFVKAAANASTVLVLDGCAVGCAKAILQNAGLPVTNSVVLSDLGLKKVKDQALAMTTQEIDMVKQAARQSVASSTSGRCPCSH
jgi:uncharacterized metal-binding protein